MATSSRPRPSRPAPSLVIAERELELPVSQVVVATA